MVNNNKHSFIISVQLILQITETSLASVQPVHAGILTEPWACLMLSHVTVYAL